MGLIPIVIEGCLWEELSGLLCWWNLPRCIGGDFIVTRFPSERSGEARFSLGMMEFSDCIYELDLMDLPLVWGGGGWWSYTWSNYMTLPLGQELIGFLSLWDWEARFPNLFQKGLLRMCSNHFPTP
jgi:hypothetical protein